LKVASGRSSSSFSLNGGSASTYGQRHIPIHYVLLVGYGEEQAHVHDTDQDEVQTMLRPPASMVGIPAMKKLAREIAGWPEEMGGDTAAACLRQVREYLNSPPDLAGDHLTAGRDLYITFLGEVGAMAGLDFSEAIHRLRTLMEIISYLAEAIRGGRLEEAAAHIGRLAQEESEAHWALSEMVPATFGALGRLN
jgi:hypothetical protein